MEINSKSITRKKILDLLRSQKEEDRLSKSSKIREKLFSIPEFQKAKIILFYASFDGEVETVSMIKETKNLDKEVALTKIIENQKRIVPVIAQDVEGGLEEGPYGIKQPSDKTSKSFPLEELDLAIVPGVAFDKDNFRLGRGGGYYDRFLAALPAHIPTIGLAFDFQIIDSLPDKEEHDLPVSRVIVN